MCPVLTKVMSLCVLYDVTLLLNLRTVKKVTCSKWNSETRNSYRFIVKKVTCEKLASHQWSTLPRVFLHSSSRAKTSRCQNSCQKFTLRNCQKFTDSDRFAHYYAPKSPISFRLLSSLSLSASIMDGIILNCSRHWLLQPHHLTQTQKLKSVSWIRCQSWQLDLLPIRSVALHPRL